MLPLYVFTSRLEEYGDTVVVWFMWMPMVVTIHPQSVKVSLTLSMTQVQICIKLLCFLKIVAVRGLRYSFVRQ